MATKEKLETADPDARFLMELFDEDLEKRIILELSREHDPDTVIRRLLQGARK